jgi:hypothetical protein
MPDAPSIPRKNAQPDSKRNETLSRTVELTAQLLHVERMEVFLQGITESVRSLFSFDRVSISILDDERKAFIEPAMAGYSEEDMAETLANPEAFSVDEIMQDFREDCKVSRLAYYIPYEKQSTPAEGFILVRDPKASIQARKSPDLWHELDLLYFTLNDQKGNIIGYMQVDYPTDHKIPSLETIQEMELFAGVAAVGIENSKMFKKTRGYLDLLTHDVGNLITPIDVYLDVVMGTTNLSADQYRYLSAAREAARNIEILINNLRQTTLSMEGLHTFRVPQSLAASLRGSGDSTSLGKRVTEGTSMTDLQEIIKGITGLEPLDVVLLRIARTISVKFGIKYVVVGVKDDATGLFKERVAYGYSSEHIARMAKQSFTLQRMKYDLREEFSVAPNTYYVRPVETGIVHKDDLRYIDNPDLAYVPRKSREEWQELDYIDIMVKDTTGDWIGWVEILEPTDRKVPTQEALDGIRVLTDLAGIAIENERLRGHTAELEDTKDYLQMITEDVGNKLESLVHYQDMLATSCSLSKEQTEWLDKTANTILSARDQVFGLRKLSELKASHGEPTEDHYLGVVLKRCATELKNEFLDRKVDLVLESDPGEGCVKADLHIDDLFRSLLRLAVRSSQKPEVRFHAKVREEDDLWVVELRDHGGRIPDKMMDYVSDGPARNLGKSEDPDIELTIMDLLVSRYHGSVTVSDRVHGKPSEGVCYELRFPKASRNDSDLQSIEAE